MNYDGLRAAERGMCFVLVKAGGGYARRFDNGFTGVIWDEEQVEYFFRIKQWDSEKDLLVTQFIKENL